MTKLDAKARLLGLFIAAILTFVAYQVFNWSVGILVFNVIANVTVAEIILALVALGLGFSIAVLILLIIVAILFC